MVTLRAVAPGDDAFLLEVYASTRADELASVPWDAATRDVFVAMQFRAQDVSWRASFPGCGRDVILVDGAAAGRLYVDRAAGGWHVVDVALLPAFRGSGIGSTVLARVLADADRAGAPVSLSVLQGNPARRLYERLGFGEVGADGFRIAMVRQPQVVCR